MTDKVRDNDSTEIIEVSEPDPETTVLAQPVAFREAVDLDAADAPDADADDSPDAEADPDADATEEADDDESRKETAKRPSRWRRDIWRVQVTLRPIPVILFLLVVISASTAGWLYFKQYRPDEMTNPRVAREVINAASEGTVALLSYSPDSLDKDFATARSHLGGDFLSYYDQFTQQIVAPAAKQKSLRTTAHVMRAAVSELHPDAAVVLVFVDQSTTSKENPDPTMAASSVLVTLARVEGKWLITKFTPV